MIVLAHPSLLVSQSWYEVELEREIFLSISNQGYFQILTIPLNGYLAAKSKNFNRTQMKNKDARAKLIDEVLSTIKVIKLYAWEIPFKRRVNEIRENELTMLKKIGYLSAAQRYERRGEMKGCIYANPTRIKFHLGLHSVFGVSYHVCSLCFHLE